MRRQVGQRGTKGGSSTDSVCGLRARRRQLLQKECPQLRVTGFLKTSAQCGQVRYLGSGAKCGSSSSIVYYIYSQMISFILDPKYSILSRKMNKFNFWP
jgi:hypothetical protein